MFTVSVYDGIKISALIDNINTLIEISGNFSTSDFKFIFDNMGTLEIEIRENFGIKINGYLATLLQQFIVVQKAQKIIKLLSNSSTTNFPSELNSDLTSELTSDLTSELTSDSSVPTKDDLHKYFLTKLAVNRETVVLNSDKLLKTEFRGLNEYLKYTEEIFVYTNIIKPTFVGNDKVKLLKIITDDSVYDKVVSLNYSSPHYMPLESRLLDRIRLFMLDSEGHKIKFSDSHSRVIYKLHFREV